MSTIEEDAVARYNNNLTFLESVDKVLYDKVKTYELALSKGFVEERYSLEYKDEAYFDIYDNVNKSYYYNTDSIKYTDEVCKNISFETQKNSFRTFYDVCYEDDVVERAKKSSILSHSLLGNAPIVQYVNDNLPEKEIFSKIYLYIIFGVGLGFHLDRVLQKVQPKICFIIEPSLEIFRLSLFTTDYKTLLDKRLFILSIAEDDVSFKKKFGNIYGRTHFYNHYIKFFMFNNNCDFYVHIMQSVFLGQGHQLYSYERELLSLSRTYKTIKDGFNFVNISGDSKIKELEKYPILILAAGPSLEKQIEFVKRNKDKFILVSIYGAMPILEKNNIKPDIVLQYDESGEIVLATVKKVKDMSFFSDTLFLFSSHVDERLFSYFDKKNLFLFQPLMVAKEKFGRITAPSIGEISYAVINRLGGKEFYLLGIDMSYEPGSRKSHYDGYVSAKTHEGRDYDEDLKTYSMRKNIIKLKGNFVDEVESLPIYKVSIDQLTLFTEIFGNTTYNLSNGAYIKGTTPLMPEECEKKLLKTINKNEEFSAHLKSSIDEISEKGFSETDVAFNLKKLEDAQKLMSKYEKFSSVNNFTAFEFNNYLSSMLKEFKEPYSCEDFVRVLDNYYKHNFHYMFYLLNLKHVSNHKKHTKKLRKILGLQINKIFELYSKIITIEN